MIAIALQRVLGKTVVGALSECMASLWRSMSWLYRALQLLKETTGCKKGYNKKMAPTIYWY